ncbi:MAG TPA: phage tail protein I [Burkholderiales bacterium]|nr:phage tail protein I [Burkholderiales bacterium]
MVNFSELEIKDILPNNLLQDKNLVYLCQAIQPQFSDITQAIMQVLFLPNLSKLTGGILEHLAWWFNLAADESWSLAITDKQKQDLIANAIEIHRYKGTLYGLKRALAPLNIIVNIEEWFEYKGEPFNFRINIDGTRKYTPEQLRQLDYYINRNKNVRSWVSGTIYSFDLPCQIKLACGLVEDELIEIYPRKAKHE